MAARWTVTGGELVHQEWIRTGELRQYVKRLEQALHRNAERLIDIERATPASDDRWTMARDAREEIDRVLRTRPPTG